MVSVRREIRIARPAAEVWAVVGDPTRLHEWFPGVENCTVEGDRRVIVLGTGIPMPERIVTCNHVLRRFQYRIEAPLFTEHQGTIDVHDLGDGTSFVVYSTDAEPRTMALVVGGGTGGALAELKRQLEGEH
jgi:carbon monoxide dehydrogenase subunit G